MNHNRHLRGHIAEIDTLRAISVFSVMVHHFAKRYEFGVNLGAFGVQVFFVISGFLITSILDRARQRCEDRRSRMRHELGVFYARRSLRIFPAYYLMIAVAAAAGIEAVLKYLPWYIFYATNFLVSRLGAFPFPGGVFWTLAVEEQFYLLWPLIFLCLPRKASFVLIGLAIAAASFYRIAMSDVPIDSFHTSLLANVDALAIGALLALLPDRVRNGKITIIMLAVLSLAALIVFPVAFTGPGDIFSTQWKLTSALIGALAVTIIVSHRNAPALWFLRIRPVMFIGQISYGIYLYHQFVNYGLEQVLPPLRGSLVFAIKVSVSIALAAISWKLFESPINRLKRHFSYRENARPSGASLPA